MTRADRLNALLAKITPQAVAHYAAEGRWPVTCPYSIETTPQGGRRITVTTDEGDTVSGRGATIGEALDDLEAKIP